MYLVDPYILLANIDNYETISYSIKVLRKDIDIEDMF